LTGLDKNFIKLYFNYVKQNHLGGTIGGIVEEKFRKWKYSVVKTELEETSGEVVF